MNHMIPTPYFDDRTVPCPITGCWLWLGSVTEHGYGTATVKRKSFKAHRLSWEVHIGPIPNGLWVLHKCDVPLCVNPNHLFLGTRQDNIADMMRKRRQQRKAGVDSTNAKLNPRIVSIMRKLHNDGVTYRAIAKMFEVNNTTVYHAVVGHTWKDLS